LTERLAPEAKQYAGGAEHLAELLLKARSSNLRPPPKLTLSQWASKYAVLSAETSAQTGRFRAYAYQVGIMDAVTDPAVNEITVMKSARVGYTKILDHVLGYFIHQDPSPCLVVQPRVEDAEDYSSTEVEPMLRDTPVIAEIVGDLKAKDSKQKLLKRVFRNGASISFVGANSPGGFRRITARVVLFDEVDGYPITGAGKEGDQIRLGKRRAQTFWNSKFVVGSTPTIKGESRIEKNYLLSDQRRFFVPCPHCGEHQVLEWGGAETPHGIKWDVDEAGNGIPETAYYACKANGCVIRDAEKPGMLERGEWRATAPFNGHAGFHIWSGYSLDPKASWPALVKEWLEVAHDPLERQTFINTVLGEPYEDRGERALAEDRLLARCEAWAGDVPDGVALLTAGVDVQDDRVEIEVVGWGRNEESWSIDYEIFTGDLEQPEFWERVDRYLLREWLRADGRPFKLEAACIDTGGSHTEMVYQFCKARIGRRIWGIKGASEQGGQRSPIWPTKVPSRKTRRSYRPTMIGTNAAKDAVRARLHIDKPGSGYMHFPADRDLAYFQQITAERLIVKLSAGRKYRVWDCPSGRANEALDCRVYGIAALAGLQHIGLKLNRRADEVGAAFTMVDITVTDPLPTPQEPVPEEPKTPPAERRVTVKVGESSPKPQPGSRARMLAS
jgi:phage terminase large subunit GpA-like protein